MNNSKENPGGHCTWDTFVKMKSNALFVLGDLDCCDPSSPESIVFCFLHDVTSFLFKFILLFQ